IYSAIKIKGERAYRKARRGESFQMPERIVTVSRFEQVWREAERAGYLIECSSGTYVRSLIADLGDAYCQELRRTAIGPFELARAYPPPPRGQSWTEPPLLSIEHALAEAERFQAQSRNLAKRTRPSVT
ncbi:MAG TPA: tRNA pseudouridine(55) synthase TruB, partial [Solirubrobacteraceae bacterium]